MSSNSEKKTYRETVNSRRRAFGMNTIEGDYLREDPLTQNIAFHELPGASETDNEYAREQYFEKIGGAALELYRRTDDEDYRIFVEAFFDGYLNILEEDWEGLKYPVQSDFQTSAQKIYDEARQKGLF